MAETLFDEMFNAWTAPVRAEEQKTELALGKLKLQQEQSDLQSSQLAQQAAYKIFGSGGPNAAVNSVDQPGSSSTDQMRQYAKFLLSQPQRKGYVDDALKYLTAAATMDDKVKKEQQGDQKLTLQEQAQQDRENQNQTANQIAWSRIGIMQANSQALLARTNASIANLDSEVANRSRSQDRKDKDDALGQEKLELEIGKLQNQPGSTGGKGKEEGIHTKLDEGDIDMVTSTLNADSRTAKLSDEDKKFYSRYIAEQAQKHFMNHPDDPDRDLSFPDAVNKVIDGMASQKAIGSSGSSSNTTPWRRYNPLPNAVSAPAKAPVKPPLPPDIPKGMPTGSKLIGTSPDGRKVYQDPSGNKWTE